MLDVDGNDEPGRDAGSRLTGATESFGFAAEGCFDLTEGADLGGVTIVRLIAEGGMGRVYEGVQAAPQRTVAVKLMRDGLVSPAALRRFEREANLLRGCSIPTSRRSIRWARSSAMDSPRRFS